MKIKNYLLNLVNGLTVGSILVVTPTLSLAATQTSGLNVQSTVVASCRTVVASTILGFGNYDPLNTSDDTTTSTINMQCTKNAPITVALNKGTTTGGTIAQRLMTNGASPVSTLQYNLYTSNAYSTVWGDGTSSSSTVTQNGAGINTNVPFIIYAKAPKDQDVPQGAYTDYVTATITY